jgi:hypothetical protein
MTAAPCKECGRRPKLQGRHRCATCALRAAPIGEQVAAARARLSMVPPELRLKRVKPSAWPDGARWCAGCQSFRESDDFGKGATRCRPCASSAQHGAMIAKTYGLAPAQYEALLGLQGGRCAICRARPKSKRLAVDHDHGSSAVRGLLCSRCNHDLLGSAWDSLAIASALWHYLNTPPAGGSWIAPEAGQRDLRDAPGPEPAADAQRPAKPSADLGLVVAHGVKKPALAAALARAAAPVETYAPLVALYGDLAAALEREKGRELIDAVKALQSRGLLLPPPF